MTWSLGSSDIGNVTGEGVVHVGEFALRTGECAGSPVIVDVT